VERLLEDARHLGRLQHGHRHLGDRPRDRRDVDRLEVLLVQAGDRRLPGDAQDRDRVGGRRVEAGDHVRARRPGRADAHADVAGLGAGVPLGHVRGALDVPGQHVLDGAAVAQRTVERIDRRTRQAEGVRDTLPLQDVHGGLDRPHAGHGCLLSGSRPVPGAYG
jgi:hypothetical protein